MILEKMSRPLLSQAGKRFHPAERGSNHRRASKLVYVSLSLLPAPAAFAQVATGGAAVEPSSTEIVVTAQKREEKSRDIPLSISAVSSNTLARRGITDAVELARSVPSLGAYPVSPGQNLLSIRGVSGFRGNSALIGTYMDEIPLSGGIRIGDGAGLDMQTMDLTRVEVLKGPQGTLFGEGAIGGVIRFISNNPELDRASGSFKVNYFATASGSGSGEVFTTLNVPLVDDKLALRVAGTYQIHGGWINNVSIGKANYNSSDLGEVRLKMLFKPTERFSITALADIHRLRFEGQNTVSIGPYEKSLFQQASIPNFPTKGYNNFELYNATATYNLGFASFLSSSSYFNLKVFNTEAWVTQIVPGTKGDPNVRGAGWEFLFPPSPGRQTNFSQEVRLTSNGSSALKWLIGANYKATNNHIYGSGYRTLNFLKISDNPAVPLVTGTTGGYYGMIRSRAVALFADASYDITDRLEVGGGIRYFREKRHSKFYTFLNAIRDDTTGVFNKNTYRAFVKYRVNDAINLYANTATGFRSGGFNTSIAQAAGASATYDPENSIFYEGGVKTSFLGGKLGLDLAYYNGKYKDQIQANFNYNASGQGIGYFANAGDATIKGVEGALTVRPARGLQLGVSGNVPRTRYTKTSPRAPVAVGDPIDFVAKYELMTSVDYDFNWSSQVKGFFNLSSTWKGKQQNSNRDSGVGYVINIGPSLNFVDATLGAEYEGLRFSVFGRNLTDERGILAPQFSGIRPQARPRQLGFSIEKKF